MCTTPSSRLAVVVELEGEIESSCSQCWKRFDDIGVNFISTHSVAPHLTLVSGIETTVEVDFEAMCRNLNSFLGFGIKANGLGVLP
jgi:hypothetical protein